MALSANPVEVRVLPQPGYRVEVHILADGLEDSLAEVEMRILGEVKVCCLAVEEVCVLAVEEAQSLFEREKRCLAEKLMRRLAEEGKKVDVRPVLVEVHLKLVAPESS